MNKLTHIALSTCVLSIILAGCTHASGCNIPVSEKLEDSSFATPTDTEINTALSFPHGVSLIPEYPTYPAGVEGINAVWKNDTDKEIWFGEEMFLERKIDGVWSRVIPSTTVWPIAIAYNISPHSQIDQAYWLGAYPGLETGDYRIATNFWDDTRYKLPGAFGEYRIYAEFAVA